MAVLFRCFASSVGLLVLATLNCAVLALLEAQTGPTASALIDACTVLSVLLAGAGVLAGVFFQRRQNHREAAFRETCIVMRRKPGDPITPAFLEALNARVKQLARVKQQTPLGQRLRFAADVLVCALMGFAVDAAVDHFLLGPGMGPRRHELEGLRILPGLLAVLLYGTYKLHSVNYIRDLRLIQTMLELRLMELSEDEAVRRKELWVIRYLSRTLLQIIYEPA